MVSETITPLLPPPAGVVSNFVNPHTAAPSVIIVIAVTLIITIIVAILRAYTRVFILRTTGFDDLILLLSLIFAAIQQSFCLKATHYGLGWHAWDVPLSYYQKYTESFFVALNFHILGVATAKVSMMLFFLRFMPKRQDKIIVYTNVGIVVAYNIGIILSLYFGCKPISTAWNPLIEDGHCVAQTPIYIAMISLNVMTDMYILIAPLPMLHRLRLPLNQKVGLGFIFMAGGLTVIITIIWLVKTLKLQEEHEASDFTYYIAEITIWAVIETNLGIIVASFPALKPLLNKIAPGDSHVAGSSGGREYGRSRGLFSLPLKSLGDRGHTQLGPEVTVTAKQMNEGDSYSQGNDSQEKIIMNGNGIVKQTELTVQYDQP